MTLKRYAVLVALLLLAIPALVLSQATGISFGAALPTNCNAGNVFIKTTATAGLYWAQTPGSPCTWAAVGTGGGSGTVTNTGTLTANAVIVGNGTVDVTALAALGASGTVLTSNGAGVPPSFQAGGTGITCESHTASASATLDFTTWYSASYDLYEISFIGVRPATDGDTFRARVSTDGGSTYNSGASSYWWSMDSCRIGGGCSLEETTATDRIQITSTGLPITNGTTQGVSGTLRLFNPASTALYKQFLGTVYMTYWVSSLRYNVDNWSQFSSTTAVNGLRFYFSTGNIADGTIAVCPVPH